MRRPMQGWLCLKVLERLEGVVVYWLQCGTYGIVMLDTFRYSLGVVGEYAHPL